MTETETRCVMNTAAIRLMNGTAGGLPRRKVDVSDSGSYAAIVDSFIEFVAAARA
jgi:hypothetical protein